MAEEAAGYFGKSSVLLEPIPGQAHWQISIAEEAIGATKDTMTAIALEDPEVGFQECLARAVAAGNSREDVRGYSPLQHALGDHARDRLALGILDVHRGPRLSQQHARLLVLLEGRHVHRRLAELVVRGDGGTRQHGEQLVQRADAVGAAATTTGPVPNRYVSSAFESRR